MLFKDTHRIDIGFLNRNKIFKKKYSLANFCSDRDSLYENVAFSILVFSTKKWYFNFLKRVFIFWKICLKVKLLKTLKISSDCHIKTFRSLKRRAIWKPLILFFRRIYALSVGFKMKPLRKNVFLLRQKPTQILH